jgi:hypothetical protein
MTKLEFPPEPYMLFRLEKLSHICHLLLHCRPLWELCHALKIKIMYTPPKNVLLLHWGWTQKHVRFSIHQINAPLSCYYLSKVLLQKRYMGLCKSYSQKIKKRRVEKKMNKIAPILLQMFPSFKKRDKFSKSKVELGLVTIYAHTCTSWFDCMT